MRVCLAVMFEFDPQVRYITFMLVVVGIKQDTGAPTTHDIHDKPGS